MDYVESQRSKNQFQTVDKVILNVKKINIDP
jgi:hypothetical protein